MRLGRVWVFAIMACGGPRNECPRPIKSAEDLASGREYGARALASTGASTSQPHTWDQPYAGRSWYPWAYYWDPDLEYARLVTSGIDQTHALEVVHRAACKAIPRRAQERSALDSYALDSTRVEDGVIVHLAADVGPPEALLVGLRCHRAWLQLIPRVAVGDDVLAVEGVKIVVRAGYREGLEVLLTSDVPAAIPELDRRARIAVTRSRRLHDTQPH